MMLSFEMHSTCILQMANIRRKYNYNYVPRTRSRYSLSLSICMIARALAAIVVSFSLFLSPFVSRASIDANLSMPTGEATRKQRK